MMRPTKWLKRETGVRKVVQECVEKDEAGSEVSVAWLSAYR